MFETVPVNDKVFLSLERCVFIAGFGLTFYFNRGTGVKNMFMPLHRTLCINIAHWTAESMEALECCRELTRNTLLWLGESENTRCLVTFWVELTKGVVQMGGHPGDDITSDSIGMPPGAKPLAHIKAMNYLDLPSYQLIRYMRSFVPYTTLSGSFVFFQKNHDFSRSWAGLGGPKNQTCGTCANWKAMAQPKLKSKYV